MNIYNIVNIFIIFVFLIPIIRGIMSYYTTTSIKFSIESILGNIIQLVALICSIIITQRVFFNQDRVGIYSSIYNLIPKQLISYLSENDILTYIVSIPLIYMVLSSLFRLVTIPIFIFNAKYLSKLLGNSLNIKNKFFQYLFRIIWAIPKSILYVLICVLLLSFYTYSYSTSSISANINESEIYQFIYNNTLSKVLNTSLAKQIPVIINDSFKKSFENEFSQNSNDNSGENPLNNIGKHKPNVIYYFNGVTLDEAIKSNAEIDKTAQNITSGYKGSKSKAKQIYTWVSKHIKYDYDKVNQISENASGISSGSIVAYSTGKGICFDYSCLFISMCRASGLKVRLITGMGYSGTSWGDHAWNQVYIPEEDTWINIDTTFGTVGSYFDNRNFNTDHRFGEIQGEW